MAIDSKNSVDQADFIRMQQVVGTSGAGAATTTQFGTVKKAATVANVAAATGGTDTATQTNLNTLITAFNLVLTQMRNAGQIV